MPSLMPDADGAGPARQPAFPNWIMAGLYAIERTCQGLLEAVVTAHSYKASCR